MIESGLRVWHTPCTIYSPQRTMHMLHNLSMEQSTRHSWALRTITAGIARSKARSLMHVLSMALIMPSCQTTVKTLLTAVTRTVPWFAVSPGLRQQLRVPQSPSRLTAQKLALLPSLELEWQRYRAVNYWSARISRSIRISRLEWNFQRIFSCGYFPREGQTQIYRWSCTGATYPCEQGYRECQQVDFRNPKVTLIIPDVTSFLVSLVSYCDNH